MNTLIPIFFLMTMLPEPPEHSVVRISPPEFWRPVEPSIAINPTNPDNIIAASIRYGDMDKGENRVMNIRYHSKDGGKTWALRNEHNPHDRCQGDDAMVFNADGIAYHSVIAFRGLRTTKQKATGIYVFHSEKDTDKWSQPSIVIDHINMLRPFEDKPYLVTDNAKESPYKGNIYITWTRFDEYNSKLPTDSSQIYFSYSADGGKRFATPFRISDTGGDCADDDDTVEGGVPAVGPDGNIYIVWSGPLGLVFDKSEDGGRTFGRDKILSKLVGGWKIDIPGVSRCNGFPVTKVDLSNGSNNGTIYVNWIDERNGDPDVFIMYSTDKGATWNNPVRVNDDPIGNDKAQFFTWMAVDPVDGSVNVVFYDRRDFEGTKTGLILARSIDGGKTFINHSINQKPFECNKQIFLGDYTGIDAFNGRVATVYGHFTSMKNTAISVAVFDFVPGTQEVEKGNGNPTQ